MKQSNTLENEIIKYLRQMKNRVISEEQATVGAFTGESQSLSDGGTDKPGFPDRQVIHNILGYARALEVLKPAGGEPMFFLRN